jgi:predicted aminopeptidase
MKSDSKKRRFRRWLLIVLLLCVVGAVCGCQTLSFYRQAVAGQYQILAHQKQLEKVIADPKTSDTLKEKLQLVQKLRAFAEKDLELPVNGHYQRYVDVHRKYVVWNVQSAPEFSLEPKTWWYPFVGSLEYRGYFSERAAQKYAAHLKKEGYDVSVGGVEAYSTLGWFKDPVLNTFIHHNEMELAEIIFHELGHQRVFASGDTDFNEAFATTVGIEGVRRWLKAKGDDVAYAAYGAALRRNEQYVHLVMRTREKLEKLYEDERSEEGKLKETRKQRALPPGQLRREKQRILGELREEYGRLKVQWGGNADYDDWFAHELNNAHLNSVANYYDLVPGFDRVLELNGGDLEKFYAAVERLTHKSKDERHQWLEILGKKESAANQP